MSYQQQIEQVLARIAELKKRWPAHTPRQSMVEELEELEEELERLQELAHSSENEK
ncbi:MAG: histidine kinase [Desulfurispora sp.]|uniref:histidine kinase n=1 Tax=Desulfurispora sp. TaxID=3014275 RepID=UPI00404B0E33